MSFKNRRRAKRRELFGAMRVDRIMNVLEEQEEETEEDYGNTSD